MKYEVTIKFEVDAAALDHATSLVTGLIYRGGYHCGIGGGGEYAGPPYRVTGCVEKGEGVQEETLTT